MNHYDMLIYRSLHQDLSVRDLNVSWRQGTSSSAHIRWSGRTEPTFSTSDTLPAGVTMSTSGVVSYDGTACTPDTYSWTVTATDGTGTVTATVTLVMAYATLVIGAGQSFKFKLGTASSQQIQYTADGTPAFAVSSGSLPAGVTMTSGGLLEYDGTGSTETTASVEVTAAMQYAQTATATVAVALKTSVIPTDCVFYAPLQNDINDHSASARTATEVGGTATVGEVKDGITCTYIPQAVRIKYPLGDVNVGSADRTFSVWFWTTSSVSWGSLMTVGANSSKAMFCIGTRTSSCLPVFSANGADLEPSSPSLKDGAWHHICASLSGTLVSLYVDGTLLGTKTITGLNTSQTDICIGGRPNVTSDIAQNAWYADARIYNRAMTGADVAELYAKGINVE